MNPCIQAVLCFVIVSVVGLIAFKIAERSVRFKCPICQKGIPGSDFDRHIREEYTVKDDMKQFNDLFPTLNERTIIIKDLPLIEKEDL